MVPVKKDIEEMRTGKPLVINDTLEFWMHKDGRPYLYVNGKEFRACSFLVTNLKPDDPRIKSIDSIDQLVEIRDTHTFEGAKELYREYGMTPDEILQAHASNIIAWIENDYNTRILHSNLSFPLLKELARSGDAKAMRVLQGEILDRIKEGYLPTIQIILETCSDVMEPALIERLLKNLEKSKNIYLWVEIARSIGNTGDPRLYYPLMRRLVKDPWQQVRVALAENPNIPHDVMLILARDVNISVRQTLWEAITYSGTFIPPEKSKDYKIFKILENDETLQTIIEVTHRKKYRDVLTTIEREEMAQKIKLPREIAEALATDPEPDVRLHVAGNPALPRDQLIMLLEDKDARVRKEARKAFEIRKREEAKKFKPLFQPVLKPRGINK